MAFYVFDKIESYFVESLQETMSIALLIGKLEKETGTYREDIEEFIETFLANFQDYFYTDEEGKEPVLITGEKGAYYPLELHVTLSSKCLQMCKHCYKCADIQGIHLDTRLLVTFLDKLKARVPYLILSGGEPTLHPKFTKIVREYSRDYKITVQSSGFHIEKYLQTLAETKCSLIVSIYSAFPYVHDEFVGVNGSYSNIMKSVIQAKNMGILVGVSTLLNKDNFSDVCQLIEDLMRMKITNITVGLYTNVGRAKENLMCSKESEKGTLAKSLDMLCNMFPHISIAGGQSIHQAIRHELRRQRRIEFEG